MIHVVLGKPGINKKIPRIEGEYHKMMFPDNGMHPSEQDARMLNDF